MAPRMRREANKPPSCLDDLRIRSRPRPVRRRGPLASGEDAGSFNRLLVRGLDDVVGELLGDGKRPPLEVAAFDLVVERNQFLDLGAVVMRTQQIEDSLAVGYLALVGRVHILQERIDLCTVRIEICLAHDVHTLYNLRIVLFRP